MNSRPARVGTHTAQWFETDEVPLNGPIRIAVTQFRSNLMTLSVLPWPLIKGRIRLDKALSN